MNKKLLSILLISGLAILQTNAQQKDTYWSSGGEFIFSTGNVKDGGNELKNAVRFTLFLHLQHYLNKDFSEKAGLYTGFSLKNIGVIYDEAGNGVRKKARTYNFGIPLALKFGNLEHDFFGYIGGQYDLVLNYKEKTFSNEQKSKFSVWFSDRTPRFVPSVFVGVQFPYGSNIQLRYYPNNFWNQDYTETDSNGATTRPYGSLEASVVSLSVSFMVFHKEGMNFKNMYKYD